MSRPPRKVDQRGRLQCTLCGVWKPPEDFYRNKRASSGLTSWCKQCHKLTPKEQDVLRVRVHGAALESDRQEQDRHLYFDFVDMMHRYDPSIILPPMPPQLMTNEELAQRRL